MNQHQKDLIRGIVFPAFFIGVLWLIQFLSDHYALSVLRYGIFPRRPSGAIGILFSPLIHSGYPHLISNTVPLLVLGWIMFYMYRGIAFQIFFWIYFITGIWVWLGGREAYHIGASGLVYGFVCFLFFSGVFRRDKRLLALSLLVTFVYGGLVWGVVPVKPTTSWESHLLGSLAGILTAFNFRREGPERIRYEWEDESDDENEGEEDDEFGDPDKQQPEIIYHITKKKPEQ